MNHPNTEILFDEPTGKLTLIENFFSVHESAKLYKYILKKVDFVPDKVKMFGKVITTKRKTAWHGPEPYGYSGIEHASQPLPALVRALINTLNQQFDLSLNSCLFNLYEDGSQAMGYHKDNEKTMDPNHPILSLSLGADRSFGVKSDLDKIERIFTLHTGDLLFMVPPFQQYWKHALLKDKGVLEPRLNLTCRRMVVMG
jgi:alkylated DNA repair dioxygenase AlkB